MFIIISILLNALALVITEKLVPGFDIAGNNYYLTAILAAIVLGVINTFIKPILLILTAPLNFLTLGLFTFVVNAVILWMASLLIKDIIIESWLAAILAAVVLSVVSTALSLLVKDTLKLARK